jgi:hypothetical protein
MVKEIASCAAAGRGAENKLDQPANDGNRTSYNKSRIFEI